MAVLHLLDFSYLVTFAKAYLLTISIEFAVCYVLNHKFGLKKILGSVTLVNSFSLPIVWFLIPGLADTYSEYVLLSEVFAVISEALLLRALLPLSIGRAFVTSLAMNMSSLVLGFPILLIIL